MEEVGAPPRPQLARVLEERVIEVVQELREMRLTQQKVQVDAERLARKRPVKGLEQERVARLLDQLHEKSRWLHEEKLVLSNELQQLLLQR